MSKTNKQRLIDMEHRPEDYRLVVASGLGDKEPSYTAGGTAIGTATMENNIEVLHKTVNLSTI